MAKWWMKSTKNRTVTFYHVLGPSQQNPAFPSHTHFRSLAHSSSYHPKRLIRRYWLLLRWISKNIDPREENIDGRRIKVFQCLEGSNNFSCAESLLLNAVFCSLFLQTLAHLKSNMAHSCEHQQRMYCRIYRKGKRTLWLQNTYSL